MSSIQHRVTGETLSFSLQDEMGKVREELNSQPARAGRTLIKDGPLTVTLVAVRSGGGLPEHKAAGPVTIHVLEGEIELNVAGESWPLSAGMLLAFEAGVPHAVTSAEGGLFLLTVVSPQKV
jgi:quercetin dioxygenase-like cupin family protein